MRKLFTTDDALSRGLTMSELKWGARTGRWRRIERGVYGAGAEDPTPLDRARARVMATRGVAGGHLAGVLHGLDSVTLDDRPLRDHVVAPDRVMLVAGIRCGDGLQTLVDLAATLDDLGWEQALESALRKGLTSVRVLEAVLPTLSAARTPGLRRIRRVLAIRPDSAVPTGSLLETCMVQVARTVPGLGDPVRQYQVVDFGGWFVAFVDLAWPELGLFVELDGQKHAGQPVHDARRETAVVAATGWLPGRFTWHEVVDLPTTTARRLAAIADQARRLRLR